jgi:hypothetical protein
VTRDSVEAAFVVIFAAAIGAFFLFRATILAQPWWLYALAFGGAIAGKVVTSRFDPATVGRLPAMALVMVVGCLAGAYWPTVGTAVLFAAAVLGWIAVLGGAVLDATVFRHVPKVPARDLEALTAKMEQDRDRQYFERGKALRGGHQDVEREE